MWDAREGLAARTTPWRVSLFDQEFVHEDECLTAAARMPGRNGPVAVGFEAHEASLHLLERGVEIALHDAVLVVGNVVLQACDLTIALAVLRHRDGQLRG